MQSLKIRIREVGSERGCVAQEQKYPNTFDLVHVGRRSIKKMEEEYNQRNIVLDSWVDGIGLAAVVCKSHAGMHATVRMKGD